MKLDFDEIQLARDFATILSKKNLYILGAGVSANYIKPNYHLLNQVKNAFAQREGFPIDELYNKFFTLKEFKLQIQPQFMTL